MRAPLALAGLTLLLAGQLAPASAHTAAVMCQGEEATIVDMEGVVEGTNGNDVIVGGAETIVSAFHGDDKVCVRGGQVAAGDGHDSIQVIGIEAGVEVELTRYEDVDIVLGDSADRVTLWTPGDGEISIDAGGGRDWVKIYADRSVLVDLEESLIDIDDLGPSTFVGVEGIFAGARRVQMTGDPGPNRLVAAACQLLMRGGRGDDDLRLASKGNFVDLEPCRRTAPRLYGQRGDDTLKGREYDDVLIGGPGRDRAFGSRGIDTCHAERKRNCER